MLQMILPNPKDALHRAMLYRLLVSLLNNKELAAGLIFKGGTCATLLGFLDRFSIDLDFDLMKNTDKQKTNKLLKEIFIETGFSVKEESKKEAFFVLKYEAPAGYRNTLKIGVIPETFRTNEYRPFFLEELTRYAICQTIETMFANKLVALTDRFKKYHTIAGRDIYDIHYFFSRGFSYKKEIIEERTGKKVKVYLQTVIDFINKKISERIISEDLSYLLPPEKFKAIRNTLKTEVLVWLEGELKLSLK